MKTITFYSYKGGVGRTLALANLARYLAVNKFNVFVLDLDLEAPGIHYKLPPTEDKSDKNKKDFWKDLGVVSYLNAWQSRERKTIPTDLTKYIYEYKTDENKRDETAPSVTINVMPAGNSRTSLYWDGVALLDWHSIFIDSMEDSSALFEGLKSQICNLLSIDYLLIDARTGITPVGGIATTLMRPDSVVLLFNNNDENLDGIKQVARAIANADSRDHQKQIEIFPVLARLPAIDPEFDNNINTNIDGYFKDFLGESINRIHLLPSQILHEDREVEVTEALVMGNSKADESSVLYRDYQILFDGLLRGQTFPQGTLLEATEVPYAERMRRVLTILEEIKALALTNNLWSKIQTGAGAKEKAELKFYPERVEPGNVRPLWHLDFSDSDGIYGIKYWESELLQKNLESFGGLKEFWVLLPRFLAYEDPAFKEITGNNLMKETKYLYFLANSEDVTRLKTVAIEIVNYLKRDRKETKETVIRETVAKNLRYVFVTDKLFRAYLRHLNYWIANPGSDIPDNDTSPQGFEVVTERGKPIGAVPLKAIECQEIFKLVKYSLGDGTALEGFSAID